MPGPQVPEQEIEKPAQPPPVQTPGPLQQPGYPAQWYQQPGWYPPPFFIPGATPPEGVTMPPGMKQPQQPMSPPPMTPFGGPMPPGPFGMPPYPPPPGEMFQPLALPPEAGSEEEIQKLAREPGHWRGDLKWVFGILAAIFLLATLTLAGFYRVTGPGKARNVIVPLVQDATGVKSAVKSSYKSLRIKAKGHDNSRFVIPKVGMTIILSGEMINSLGPEDLANRVSSEVASKLYANGYRSLPPGNAFGIGELRAQAVSVTLLSVMNKKTHSGLLLPMIVASALAFAFFLLLLVFCFAWGKAIGVGIVVIGAALPVSLFIRIASEIIWPSSGAGMFETAMGTAMRQIGGGMVLYFDIALGAGALLLLVGVVGAIISKRTKERVPPFLDLERAKPLTGEPPVDFLLPGDRRGAPGAMTGGPMGQPPFGLPPTVEGGGQAPPTPPPSLKSA